MPQRVLVTAGAAGIGLAIAEAFVTSGAQVHVADIDAQAVAALTSSGRGIGGSVADVGVASEVDRLFDEMRGRFDGLDVLVNNAGIAGPAAATADYPDSAWSSVLDVNLTGTFHVTKRAIPLLKRSARGAIVIMSSVAGRYGYPNRVAYSTTKWGLVGFMKTLALELGPHGITCNTVHPGAVAGPRLDAVFEGRARLSGRSPDEERELALRNQSIARFTDAADIAQLVLFLAGPSARTLSGQTFPIDGDSKAAQ